MELRAKDWMYSMCVDGKEEWGSDIQIFADDMSAALAHGNEEKLTELAWSLSEVLNELLKELDLEDSVPTRNNFIFEALKNRGYEGFGNSLNLRGRSKGNEKGDG